MSHETAAEARVLELDLQLARADFELKVALRSEARVTGLFGPSGAGKSSVLRSIAGLERGARGRICFGGEVWLHSEEGRWRAPHRRSVGYVPQQGLLFPHLDVRGNLLAGRHHLRAPREANKPSLDEVSELLELGSLLARQPDSLSGGERQRVALGRALCSGAELLLLDEPLASLDHGLRRRVLPLLLRVREELGVSMVLVSHDVVEVQTLCDEVWALERGRLVAGGAAREVLSRPEVFPLARQGDYENVLVGTVVTTEGGLAKVRLNDGQGAPLHLWTPPAGSDPGQQVLVGIPAREILLALHHPEGLSARNVLPARLRRIDPVGELVLLEAQLAAELPPLLIEVTPQACKDLELRPELAVCLIVKAWGINLYERVANPSS